MAEKLRSISKRIHWSSLLKGAIFGLAWGWLPFWLFLLIALYLYLAPLFQAKRLAVPFFVLLIICYLQAPSLPFVLIFGAVFFLLLLIKDLLLIDRQSAYELLVLTLSFLLLRLFYLRSDAGVDGVSLWYAFLLAVAITLLARSFINAFKDDIVVVPRMKTTALWLGFVLFWQAAIVGLFLPLDFIYQTVVVFLVIVLFLDLVPAYLMGSSSRTKTLTTATAIFCLLVITLSSARLGI